MESWLCIIMNYSYEPMHEYKYERAYKCEYKYERIYKRVEPLSSNINQQRYEVLGRCNIPTIWEYHAY